MTKSNLTNKLEPELHETASGSTCYLWNTWRTVQVSWSVMTKFITQQHSVYHSLIIYAAIITTVLHLKQIKRSWDYPLAEILPSK